MKYKLMHWIPSAICGLVLSTSVGLSAPVISVNTFDANVNGVWDWYGGCTLTWDGAQDHSGNSGGSLHLLKSPGNDSIMCPLSFAGNNWDNCNAGNQKDLTLYTNLSFWFKWDTSSTMGISDFNSTFGGLNMLLNDNHLGQYDWSGGGLYWGIPTQPIPNAASNGWVRLIFPFNNTVPYINQIGSIVFRDWHTVPWSGTVAFWVDDIEFDPAASDVIPPPTIKPLTKAISGLNVFNSTSGQYDRQEAMLRQTDGLQWVGQATPANPVSYSFTIKDFPNNPSGGAEAYLFLSPNPNAIDGAPDWNETNCVVVYLQSNGSGTATIHFQYKVNNAYNNAMYGGGTWTVADTETIVTPDVSTNYFYFTNAPGSMPGGLVYTPVSPGVTNVSAERGELANITNPTPLGTWTVKFTSDTNVTLITPSGTSTNFIIPAYNIGTLAPVATPLNIYLGGQANNTDGLYKAVVYSNFSVTGSATPFSENFLTETTLDTVNTWNNSMAAGSSGVFIAPATSAYWLTWTLPAAGYNSEVSGNLANPLAWTAPANNKTLTMNGSVSQLIYSTDLPAGSAAYFHLIKRIATQLQVLLPGETNAPNTLTGKVGTPNHVSLSTDNGLVNVTINSVDATWHIVNSTDTVDISTTDTAAGGIGSYSLANGTLQHQMQFQTQSPPNWTVTATNISNVNIAPGTSAPLTVDP